MTNDNLLCYLSVTDPFCCNETKGLVNVIVMHLIKREYHGSVDKCY